MTNKFTNYCKTLIIIFGFIFQLFPWYPDTSNYQTNKYFPAQVHAATQVKPQAPLVPGREGKPYANLGEYLTDLYTFSIWLISAISIIMIIIGGYLIITSSGQPEGVQKGRGMIVSALMSLGLLVLAWVLLRMINPQIKETGIMPADIIQSQSTIPSSVVGGTPLDPSDSVDPTGLPTEVAV